MKKTYIFLMLLLGTISVFSQTNDECECLSIYDTLPIPQDMYSHSTQFDKATNPHMIFNIKYWVLREDDGSSINITEEDDILISVANLNRKYNEFNIYFKYYGFEYVDDNTAYYETRYGIIKDRFNELGLETGNSLNVILHDLFTDGCSDWPGTFNMIYAPHLTEWVLWHEIGYNFGLYHTWEKWHANCEHVTRDPASPYFNATTHGDRIVDTAAICSATLYNNYDYSICDFTQQGYDCQDPPQPYDLDLVDLLNIMNINKPSNIYTCRTMFSTGQGVWMRETILGWPDIFVPVSASVSDLFEPYDGEYELCNGNENHNPKFQPGFDYEFIECRLYDTNQQNCPTPFGDHDFLLGPDAYEEFDSYESYDSSYNLPIIHPNHTAIYIADLNDYTNKCYDAWKNASAGKVKNFLDGVINTNYTIQYLDSLQINSPSLIPDLQNGLYNIEKNYNNGTNIQNTILKDD